VQTESEFTADAVNLEA